MVQLCPCGSQKEFAACCEIIHQNPSQASSAQELMRARYAAFCTHHIDFLYNSTHPQTRRFHNKKDIQQYATESKWMFLEIIASSKNTVEFKAHYMDKDLNVIVHHEKSNFKQLNGTWYYLDGRILS